MKELVRANSLLRHAIDIFLRAAVADSGAPLGTILGNFGINTVKFVKEFNDFTAGLPSYFILCTRIFIYENRTSSFLILGSSTGFFFDVLKLSKSVQVWHFDRMNLTEINYLPINSMLKLCWFKFRFYSLQRALSLVWSTLETTDLKVNVE